MRALITGATGFAGSHLAEFLLSRGDRVLGCSRRGKWSPDAPPCLVDQVELLACDFSSASVRRLAGSAADFQVDSIFHLAALSVPADCGRERPTDEALSTNVDGTRAIVEMSSRLPTRPRLLFTSSCYVYAPVNGQQAIVTEDAPLAPAEGYGQTKLAAESEVQRAARAGTLDTVIVRAFQHTGPRQSARMIVPDWARQFTLGSGAIRVVSLDTFLDLLDVRDAVRSYRALMVDGEAGGVYNVGSGTCYRSGDIFEQMRRLSDPDRDVIEVSPSRRQHPIADTTKLRRRTGWRPEIPFEKTLADTLSYWKRKAELG